MTPVDVSLGKTHLRTDHPWLNLRQVALSWGFCAYLVLCTLVMSFQRRQQLLSAEIYFHLVWHLVSLRHGPADISCLRCSAVLTHSEEKSLCSLRSQLPFSSMQAGSYTV